MWIIRCATPATGPQAPGIAAAASSPAASWAAAARAPVAARFTPCRTSRFPGAVGARARAEAARAGLMAGSCRSAPGKEASAATEVHRPDRVAVAVEAAGHEAGAGHLELAHQHH